MNEKFIGFRIYTILYEPGVYLGFRIYTFFVPCDFKTVKTLNQA